MIYSPLANLPVSRFFYIGYLLVCIWLGIGLVVADVIDGVFVVSLHLLTFAVVTPLLCKVFRVFEFGFLKYATGRVSPVLGKFFCIGLLAIAFSHWAMLGGVPFIKAVISTDVFEIARIRNSAIYNTPSAINYAYSILGGGVLPVLCLFLFVVRDRFRFAFYCIVVVYLTSFLQKAPVLILVAPLVTYFFILRKWVVLSGVFFVSLLAFFSVHFALNGYFSRSPEMSSEMKVIANYPSEEISGRWRSVEFKSGRGWRDASGQFKSQRFFQQSGVYFDGATAIYKPLPKSVEIGKSDFSINFTLDLVSDVYCASYGTVFFLGPRRGWEGVFQILLKCDSLQRPIVEFVLYDSTGAKGFSYQSSPLDIYSKNFVGFDRRGRDVQLRLNNVVRAYATDVIDISPISDQPRLLQFGAQFGGNFREGVLGRAILRDFRLQVPGEVTLEELANLDGLIQNVDSLLEPAPEFGSSPFLLAPGSLGNLLDRLLFVPGRTGGIWMQLIPKEFPFAKGCGYRPVALLMGCEFVNFPVVIHQRVEPDLWADGVQGTMNAAEVFNGYANFGLAGAIATAVLMALMAWFVGCVYHGRHVVGYALTSPFLIMQSSVGLPVTLVSGGWLASLLLFMLLRHYLSGEFSEG